MGYALAATHTTKDGETMLIAAMTTRHLLNTVRLFFSKIEELTLAVKQDPADVFKNALYGKAVPRPEDAAVTVNELMEKLYPYIAELFFRVPEIKPETIEAGILDEIWKIMKAVYVRDGKLEGFDIESSRQPPRLSSSRVSYRSSFSGDPVFSDGDETPDREMDDIEDMHPWGEG